MATLTYEAGARPVLPAVRRIGLSDLRDALGQGIDDFRAMPTEAVFLCLLYPIVGLLLGRALTDSDALPLLYPFIAGFALVGPFAAVGLYELSRRREAGLDTEWSHAFDVFRSPAKWSIFALGVLLTVIFVAWLAAADTIFARTIGDAQPASLAAFFRTVVTTPAGWALIVIGNGVGFLFAVVALAVSVISFPLELDRDVGAPAAIVTSVRAVLANPIPMAAWGLIVAVSLALGSIPFLFGLAVVLPVLGHATWHLYRKVVV
jgi:uncharacterized membrane protein